MKIDIEKIVEFFDNTIIKGSATSIAGILGEDLNAWAFKHFMENEMGNNVEILKNPVTTGKKKGKWLDRWIYVKNKKEEKLYQCEIKNWSSSAIGGYHLDKNSSKEKIIEACKHNWFRQSEAFFSNREFPNSVTKSLVEMKKPAEYININVEPVVIYWMPISCNDEIKPFFNVSVSSLNNENIKTSFKKFGVFSVSLYLRELLSRGNKIIEVDMPNVKDRMNILKSIIV